MLSADLMKGPSFSVQLRNSQILSALVRRQIQVRPRKFGAASAARAPIHASNWSWQTDEFKAITPKKFRARFGSPGSDPSFKLELLNVFFPLGGAIIVDATNDPSKVHFHLNQISLAAEASKLNFLLFTDSGDCLFAPHPAGDSAPTNLALTGSFHHHLFPLDSLWPFVSNSLYSSEKYAQADLPGLSLALGCTTE
ncbi:hypothetical protein B0H13DRAFT_2288359 [Mycena leptocephala]|nr:hypothetical protein B0H13DRAFT_2288359 [Mycena leptocephala]